MSHAELAGRLDKQELTEGTQLANAAIDWVLFTAIDAYEHVVDAGGGLI